MQQDMFLSVRGGGFLSNAKNLYEARMRAHGANARTAMFNREARMLERRMRDSLSYFTVYIDDDEREVAVINSDNLNEKHICTLPCEDFDCGQLVTFADNRWLITEKDASNELYTRGIMLQCNHLLKWVGDDGLIHSQWCVVEDGTKLFNNSFRVARAA